MKSCSLMKPRAGAKAGDDERDRRRLPDRRCDAAVAARRTAIVTLARLGPIMLRVISSARVGSRTVSPISDGPHRPVGGDAGQMRTIELHTHDIGVGGVGEIVAADGAARLAVKRAEIDIGFRIEHDPERVGAVENRGSGRRRERKRQFQVRALAGKLDGDLAAGSLAAARLSCTSAVGRRLRRELSAALGRCRSAAAGRRAAASWLPRRLCGAGAPLPSRSAGGGTCGGGRQSALSSTRVSAALRTALRVAAHGAAVHCGRRGSGLLRLAPRSSPAPRSWWWPAFAAGVAGAGAVFAGRCCRPAPFPAPRLARLAGRRSGSGCVGIAVGFDDIDDIALLVTEGAHIDFGGEDETDQRRIAFQFAADRPRPRAATPPGRRQDRR